jgi:hypothetical protein
MVPYSFHESRSLSLTKWISYSILQHGTTALDLARGNKKIDCVKLLEMADYRNILDKVMFSLLCSRVVLEDMAGESSASNPLREFCTDKRYRHLMESMMGMIMGDSERGG